MKKNILVIFTALLLTTIVFAQPKMSQLQNILAPLEVPISNVPLPAVQALAFRENMCCDPITRTAILDILTSYKRMVERCEELDAKYNEFSTFAWKNQTYDMECKDLWKAIEGDDFKNRPFLDDVNTQWSNIAGRDYVCNIALLAGDVGRLTELMTLYMQSFYRYRSRWSEWYTCTNIGKFPVK